MIHAMLRQWCEDFSICVKLEEDTFDQVIDYETRDMFLKFCHAYCHCRNWCLIVDVIRSTT